MSQSDYNIGANPSGLDMRTEINQVFDSILTHNSGSTAPTVTKAFMMWVDTSNVTYYYLKMRDHDNTAWITLGTYTVATKTYISYIDGDQTITGIKTFGSFLITPSSAPTTNYQVANKKYVDDNVGAAASETIAGKIELATTAEAQAGTDDLRAITPLKLRNALNASGSAPIYACRAWVNFNGTETVAIRASGNVSSITDSGVGFYTVNFTTPLVDANYSVATISTNAGIANGLVFSAETYATTHVFMQNRSANNGNFDSPYCSVSIFR